MSCSSSDIFLIKAETYANSGDFGIPCFNGDAAQTFLNSNWISYTNTLCMGDSIGGLFSMTRSSCNSQENVEYDIEVTKYGGLVNKETFYSLDSQKNSVQIENSQGRSCGGCCLEGGKVNALFQYERENGVVVKNESDCDTQLGTPPECDGNNNFCGNLQNSNCFTFGDDPTECTTYSFEYNHPNCFDAYDGFQKAKSYGSLMTPVTYDNLFPKADEAVNIKIDILNQNSPQNNQGYNCGNEKTSCYGHPAPNVGYSYDTLYAITGSNYDIVVQKWRVKVAQEENILKNDLSQKYELYSYYYTGENPDTTVSPCCNSCECFDGVIFAQKDITLTYNNSSDNKKDGFILSNDYLEFYNYNYVGPSRNLYYCNKRI